MYCDGRCVHSRWLLGYSAGDSGQFSTEVELRAVFPAMFFFFAVSFTKKYWKKKLIIRKSKNWKMFDWIQFDSEFDIWLDDAVTSDFARFAFLFLCHWNWELLFFVCFIFLLPFSLSVFLSTFQMPPRFYSNENWSPRHRHKRSQKKTTRIIELEVK